MGFWGGGGVSHCTCFFSCLAGIFFFHVGCRFLHDMKSYLYQEFDVQLWESLPETFPRRFEGFCNLYCLEFNTLYTVCLIGNRMIESVRARFYAKKSGSQRSLESCSLVLDLVGVFYAVNDGTFEEG
ncbi:hypothetical protein PFLUV_G00020320 [Perca fluviatilis]|uniref:Uncharacterized protein n=1 Tax=Perca fluviatilis TaxID=8168 RepID=A0A6A5FLY0_PERFL|nr:hypothetical protein PFLUV_G00020320 [Perca fluviatilis]